MATSTIAQFATTAGAVVTVQESRLLGLFDWTFTATCGGCGAGTTESTHYTPAETAQASATYWAERHATGCRRIPAH